MPIFAKKDLQELSLPITNGRVIDLIKKQGIDLLLASAYSDGFIITGQNLIFFFVEVPDWDITENRGLDRMFHEYPINGSFFLNGKIIRKGKSLLIGAFSYAINKHGYIWGGDFRNKCIPL